MTTKKELRFYGILDIIFALLYLFVFIVLLPAHEPLARMLTIGFPLILLGGGIYMVYGGKWANTVGLSLATLFLTLTLILIMILMFTAGYFKGIYGPLGKGISTISYLMISFVIEFMGIWPFFQMKALWSSNSKRVVRRRIKIKSESIKPEKTA
jgi:hypothetical protein